MKSKLALAGIVLVLGGATVAVGLSDVQSIPVEKSIIEKVTEATTTSEKADIKSTYIVSKVASETFTKDALTIEIQNIEKIDGGVQIFARAWKDGKQLGFGSDGTTDIERFRIFNPPILVPDVAGTIVHTVTYQDGSTKDVKYREDALLAIKETLAHTILVAGKTNKQIKVGSVGNTTDTFFSNANGDGAISTNASCTFASGRDGTCGFGGGVNTTSASQNFYEDTLYSMRAVYYPFDTSSVPSGNTISSATFSLYGDAAGLNVPARGVGVLQSAQASLTALATGDWVPASYTELATRKNIADLVTGAYNDYTLTNLAVIAKGSSFTKLMILNGPIIDNDSVSGSWYFNFFSADQVGTTNDPKLVVVHEASAVGSPNDVIWFQ